MNKQLVQPLVPRQSARPLSLSEFARGLLPDRLHIRKNPMPCDMGCELGVMVCIISCSCWRHRLRGAQIRSCDARPERRS
ncbi:hypothetical protein APV28_1082 [Comamonas testosteroni]|nr:hypothetical protein APV28_1082 [Comamonas testosteroni]